MCERTAALDAARAQAREQNRERVRAEFCVKAGYLTFNGQWLPGPDALDAAIEEERQRQAAEQAPRLRAEIYEAAGYRQVDGVWQRER